MKKPKGRRGITDRFIKKEIRDAVEAERTTLRIKIWELKDKMRQNNKKNGGSNVILDAHFDAVLDLLKPAAIRASRTKAE